MRITPIGFALFALASFMALLCDCATLTAIPVGTCGNGVVDANEDCDGFPTDTCGKPESGATACRLTCDRLTAGACGPNKGCGVDGICRGRTGTFTAAGAPLSSNAFTLIAGDFDADGHTDIVGSPPFGSAGGSRVHYFDRAGALATTTTLNIPIPLGLVRDFDGDKLDDLGFAVRSLTLGAFGGLGGRRDRSFSTLVFPSLTFPNADARFAVLTASPTITLPSDTRSCAVGVLSDGRGNALVNLCGGAVSGDTPYAVPVSFRAADVVGEPRTGRTKLTSSVCGEIILGTNTAAGARVWVAGPCTPPGIAKVDWSNDPALEIPVEGMLEDLFVGPVFSPGTDDILVHTTTGFYVLAAGKFVVTTVLKTANALPLVTGDLDGDELIDFVFPTGIALTTASPFADGGTDPTPKRGIPPRDQLRWASARIGRFNNDDLPDLLVSFPDALDVDVLLNGGGGRFTPFTIRSEQAVRETTAGDYDGDGIADVAFLQGAKSLGPDSDADLVIAYGAATGGPEAPHVVGHFKDARALGALRNSVTSIDDLGVLETAAGVASLTVLFGSGGRQQVAPLFMSDIYALAPLSGALRPNKKDPVRLWQPVSFAVGAFRTAGTQEIMSVATGFTINPALPQDEALMRGLRTGVWLAESEPSKGRSGLLPFAQVGALDDFTGLDESRLRNGGNFELGTLTVSGDVSNPRDGIDELISVTRTPGGGAAVFLVPAQKMVPPKLAVTIPEAMITGGEPIDLVDVDGDGALDLVVVLRVAGQRRLHVFRGDGRAGFAAPTVIALPQEPIAFTALATGGNHVELAIATETKVFLASLDRMREVALGIAAPKLTAIVAGDVDGDGVPDLAIADNAAIRILHQQPGLK